MQQPASNPHELSTELRHRLLELVRSRGLRRVSSDVGVSPQTVASLAAGIRVHASMVALVQRRLAEILTAETSD
jgi:hypothetical protein